MPPLLGRPESRRCLCPFCSITGASGKLGRGSALVPSPMLGSGRVAGQALQARARVGSLRGVQGRSTPRPILRTPAGPRAAGGAPALSPISGPQLLGLWGSLCYKLIMQLQCWTLFHVLNFPFAAAFYVVLLRPHSIPQSPYGSWGRLSRAITGYALREGLGLVRSGGLRE